MVRQKFILISLGERYKNILIKASILTHFVCNCKVNSDLNTADILFKVSSNRDRASTNLDLGFHKFCIDYKSVFLAYRKIPFRCFDCQKIIFNQMSNDIMIRHKTKLTIDYEDGD